MTNPAMSIRRAPLPVLVANLDDRCGEGPVWNVAEQRLFWTDATGRRIAAFQPDSGAVEGFPLEATVSALALDETGGLIAGGGFGLARWNPAEGLRTIIAAGPDGALCINDLVVDSRGRVYASTIHWGVHGMEKHGGIYRIESGGRVEQLVDGLELANGMDFSPDGRRFYYADSAQRTINVADVEPTTGALTHPRVWVQAPAGEGLPDGLTVDAAGFVWSAQWYGSQVVRYDPDGHVEHRIALPVPQVASLAFGGPDLADLFITSAAELWRSPLAPPGYDFNRASHGGGLYRVPLEDVRGLPGHRALI